MIQVMVEPYTSSIPNKKRHSTLKRCHSQTKRAIEKVDTDSESYANKLKIILLVIFNRVNFQPAILLAASKHFWLAAATCCSKQSWLFLLQANFGPVDGLLVKVFIACCVIRTPRASQIYINFSNSSTGSDVTAIWKWMSQKWLCSRNRVFCHFWPM